MIYDHTEYDVVVIGAGPAGISAAISAVKNGAKTLLVEKEGSVGGMSTNGLLTIWCGHASSSIYEKIRARSTIRRGNRAVFDPEALKYVYLAELKENNVDLLLHAQLCKVNQSDQEVKSIEVLTKSGILTIKGKVFIDSTGDGDAAHLSGVAYTKGRESDGLMQPMSLMFSVGNVDEDRAVYPTFGTHPELEVLMSRYVAEGKVSRPAGHVILIEGYHKGTASVNMTNVIKVDGTNAVDLTYAELHAREQVMHILQFLRECVPGYENCYLIQSANYIGVRETRHFEGEFRLTEQHIQNNTVFDDWTVSGVRSGFGNHNLTGSGYDENNLEYNGKPYTIPYGAFVAKGLSNLYLNGRCISGTHMAHASFRLMPVCFAMGQGVGTAAALCAKRGINIRDINIKELQGLLIDQGVEDPRK